MENYYIFNSNFVKSQEIKEVWKKLEYSAYNGQLKENTFPITLIVGNIIELNSFPIEITRIV